MTKKRTSLYEETKIQMVMKIYNISRNKAIDYIAKNTTERVQKLSECSKNEPDIHSNDDEDLFVSAEEFFA
jgi:hypothetical protein